jgi:hypothetical protein
MRTSRAWAVARNDGSLEVGPMPTPPLATVPAARVLTGLGVAFRFSAQRGMRGSRGKTIAGRRSRSLNRRFLLVLLSAEAVMLGLGSRLDTSSLPWVAGAVLTTIPLIATLFLIRVAAPGALWRYHGAEHKAVAAFETGVDLHDVDAVMKASRVHNRCGTNLVTLLAIMGLVINPLPLLIQIPLFAVGLGLSAELLTIAAGHPTTWWSRALLSGGRLLQRYVTTAEPSYAELEVACRSLLGCLAEHERVAAPVVTAVLTSVSAPRPLIAA